MKAMTKPTLKPFGENRLTILVLGGYGFIGRHIVAELEALNAIVLKGTRRSTTALSPNNERHIMLHKLQHNLNWLEHLDGIDVVINTVGILRQRRAESYEQVHHQAVIELANACADRGIRFIHISALGLNNAVKSRFLTSKLNGEQALSKSNADWHLVRPSIVDGNGGYGARWFKRIAQWPLHFIPSNARGILAPIHASDLGKAVAAIALSKKDFSAARNVERIYEIGGLANLSLKQYLKKLKLPNKFKEDKNTICIEVPALVSRVLSHICDLLHLTPFSFGHYELLKYDNLPSQNRLKELLLEWAYCKHSPSPTLAGQNLSALSKSSIKKGPTVQTSEA